TQNSKGINTMAPRSMAGVWVLAREVSI
ncbi:MAG: hypothetical protein ACI9U2_003966, partial [Bradymonadia bacterium]